MFTSTLQLFKIGVGPSSSHTVGPMWAMQRFLRYAEMHTALDKVTRVRIDLYGSLALTGKGHATDRAVLAGLAGFTPDSVDPQQMEICHKHAEQNAHILMDGQHPLVFRVPDDLIFHTDTFLEEHANGMRVTAYAGADAVAEETYFSVGGGFISTAAELAAGGDDVVRRNVHVPYGFDTARDLLALCAQHDMSIADIMWANEGALAERAEVVSGLDRIEASMMQCIERGIEQRGNLPGGLHVKRRAHEIFRFLQAQEAHPNPDTHLRNLDWVNLFALAVNEENAAGGRVVTAPTNGAAGIIPAVLRYYRDFIPTATSAGRHEFLLTAAAIAILYKKNASISAAEVGCQGEVGVACSMAAAALTAVLGGTPAQVENAAEIGMEHNLGLTCDPIGGLVQIPCIERNTMGAVKAINAARLALLGDGKHFVPLDSVIQTMWETGRDMQSKYKETSTGGLAINFVAC